MKPFPKLSSQDIGFRICVFSRHLKLLSRIFKYTKGYAGRSLDTTRF